MKKTKKILLIGRSGRGKSTLANVIVGTENKFEESSGSASKTKKIQAERFEDVENDINYWVIDTPGIGDTKMSDNEVLDIIAEAVYLARDGVDRVFFVINKRFDQSEMATYNLLRTIIFDEKITNHTTITRTCFDDFKDGKKCQTDIDSMFKEAKEKKTELESKVADKEKEKNELEKEKVSHDSEQYKKVVAEIEKLNKELKANISEIIESCQGRVIHVSNPPINVKNERRLKLNKSYRIASREKLLEHLKNTCQDDIYRPEKLKELSAEITEDMDKLLQSRKELEEEMKKLQTNQISSTDNQSSQATISKNPPTISTTSSKPTTEKEPLENTPEPINEDNKMAIGEVIAHLEDKKEKLQKEIAEKEKIIRQKVLKHIFNNYNDISNELGGDIFLGSVVGEHDWEKIRQEFSSKELVVKWLSKEFDYDQVQKWAIVLGSNFNPEYDVYFCSWLRDDKKLTVERIKELSHVFDIEQLKKEYIEQLLKETDVLDRHNKQLNQGKEDWKDIHPDFRGYFGEEQREKWQAADFNVQQTKEWIDVGLKPSETEIATYARWKGYQPSSTSITELRKEYYQAQNWLEYHYPMGGETKLYLNEGKKRSEIKLLNISNKNLEGSLMLEGFASLHEFYCDDNELVGLKINDCPNLQIINCAKNKLLNLDLTSLVELTKLNCGDNSLISSEFLTKLPQPWKLEELQINDNEFVPQDLSFLSGFTNLRELDLSGNKFYGSLRFLKDIDQLEMLNIERNNIDKGWGYLPQNLQYFYHSVEGERGEELKKYWENLKEKQKLESQRQWLEAKIEVESNKL